ncbi:hypothetical protein [Rhodococcus sp. NPDC057529]|uniref:hypothetical protein n=1 Tax=Rhodococcus sp. NPDC057529 TaxID=3346158 RepID=UPI003670584E
MKALAKLARDRYTVGRSLEGRVFVTPKSGPRVSRWLTENSEEIVSDLALYLRDVTGEEFSRTERDNALLSLRDEARAVPPVRTASRIANPRPGVIAVDMCNDAGECYVITKDGWSITTDPGDDVVFIRGENARPLPRAVTGGDLSRIWEIANVPEESRQLIVCNWHTAMQRSADHPIISLVGQAGSAKTSLSAILSYLLDPIEGEGFDSMPIALPEDPAEIYALASSQYFIPFDNVDSMTKQQQTAMSVIATGGIYARRELYTTARIYRAPVRGCLILASIDLGKVKPDFMDRVITVEIEPIPGGVFRDRAEVKAAFDAMHADVLGGLFDQAVSVLGVYDQVQKNMQQLKIRTSRLSTFSYTLASLDSLYGTSAFPQFMQEQASRQAESATGDALTACVMALIDGQAGKSRTYSPTELLSELEKQRKEADPFARTPMGWPANAQHLTKRIKEMEIPLDRAGYSAAYRRTNKARGWVLARKPAQETAPTTGTVVPINRGTHAPHTSAPAAPEQVAVRTGTDDVDTVTPAATSTASALSHQCRHLGDRGHRECQRNRAKSAPLAVACSCECHDERGDQGDAPTPTEPTSAAPTEPTSAAPTEPTSAAPTEPTSAAPTEPGAFERALARGDVIDSSELPRTQKKRTGTEALSESAARRTVGAGGLYRKPMHYTARVTAYVDLGAGVVALDTGNRKTVAKRASLLKVIAALPEGVERISLVGHYVGGSPDSHRKWCTAGMAEEYDDLGAFEGMPYPLYLYRHRATGRKIEIRRTAEWLGEQSETDPYSANDARDALGIVTARLRGRFGKGAALLSSPTTTGRVLLESKLPMRYTSAEPVPSLSAEHRELYRSHMTQHRREVTALDSAAELPGFAYLDGRFMFAALTRNVGTGPGSLEYRGEFQPYSRGIWNIRFTVPDNWAHVGLLSAVTDDGLIWPSTPGSTWETWAETAEVKLALQNGWRVEFKESLLLDTPNADPLKAWRDALVAIRTDIAADVQVPDRVRKLAAGAVRDMLLHAIGSFNTGAAREQTRRVTAAEIPANVLDAEPVGGGLFKITETVARKAGDEKWQRPEWAGKIWAESRVRMLSWPPKPGAKRADTLSDWAPIGALHLPREQVLGFYGDAVYLTRDPEWADDGAEGRLRVKGQLAGPLPVPATEHDLFDLARRSEGSK